ncbi:uncharacterized protein LOC144161640 [Haemaphysalis longicornis]|uniref:Uncharacterized protein n=1 Tax=Haemaphysalis longicornis TaxID=44386 RepID=A0A9J6FWW7_HAELO|nr:hypothetical protein HPB48_018452 [Haemaphysalis longicornis]
MSDEAPAATKPPSVLSLWHGAIFYIVLTVADRLQNPYEYKLYYYYNLDQGSIARIYAAGALGGCMADLWGVAVSKRVGWTLTAPLLLGLYFESCMLKDSEKLSHLVVSKILSKVCVLTLFPLALGQFNPRMRPSDLAIILVIGFLGIVCGVVSSILCDIMYYNCYLLYKSSAYILVGLFLFHFLKPKSQPIKGLVEPYRADRVVTFAVLSSEVALWCCSTIVEAYWAPLVNPSNMDVGLLYALYCFFHVFGSCFFRVLRMIRATPRYSLTLACILAGVGMFFAAVAMPVYPDSVLVIVMAMLAFHFGLGLWGAVMRKLRSCAHISPGNEAYARCAGRLLAAAMLAFGKELDTQYLCNVFTFCCCFMVLSLLPVQSLARWKQKTRIVELVKSVDVLGDSA